MSARSGITQAMVSKLSELMDGTGDYVNNLYGNVDSRVVHFDDVEEFPYISITPGAETREDMPSNFTWATLNMNITIYVKSEEATQASLESIISDVETFLDTNLQLDYTVVTSDGELIKTTVDNTITQINTDEGILSPLALGQVTATVRYEKIRKTAQ
jgi:hypothetical protein|tara:strand:- start:569 stop:1042 length:474 start_codon:yes stop_codon:yes gene_type:complete